MAITETHDPFNQYFLKETENMKNENELFCCWDKQHGSSDQIL